MNSSLRMAVLTLLLFCVAPALAQEQCGTVDAIDFPIDTTVFQLAQDYGAPSPRHQGRYHTGEDWFGGRDTSLGSPVMAIANGRVTYSAPNGWGRDGGVVILEHTFPNGEIAYSMYGHMMESGDITFPARLTCVVRGQVIGAVGDSRPAPHLHWEMRSNNPDIPGPGYEWESPDTLGYLRPSQFVVNWRAWLHEAHRWHVRFPGTDLAQVPPLVLEDQSLLVYDGTFLRRVLPDGRILWRATLEQPLVGITGYQRTPLLFFADGTVQRADNMDGSLLDRWSLGVRLHAPALWTGGDELYFVTEDEALIAVSDDRRSILWRLDGVPPFVRGTANPFYLGLVSADHRLFVLSSGGDLLDEAQLRALPGLTGAEGGHLLVMTRSGLWRVTDGRWTAVGPGTPPGQPNPALAVTRDDQTGAVYAFDGARLLAYDAGGAQIWSWEVGTLSGAAALSLDVGVLALVSAGGDLRAARTSDGFLCADLRLWGSPGADVWSARGTDGIWRVIAGEQILALDWADFTRFCGEG